MDLPGHSRGRDASMRVCCQGDQQVDGVDVFDAFVPVTNWGMVRVMLTLSITSSMATQQVDCTAVFCQAELHKPVCMEMPMGFARKGYICELHKGTHGLIDVPKH